MAPNVTEPIIATPISTVVEGQRMRQVVDGYRGQWSEDNEQDKKQTAGRTSNYMNLVNTYYDLSTDFYEYGWGECFHFANWAKNETLERAIARHEHYLALQLQLRPGMRVLDVGCGIGGPMREIARFSGANCVGVNNNAHQLGRASVLTARAGLQSQCTYVQTDFMAMPFEGEFDAAYAIEATCHAPSLAGVYSQIFKALKPGGMFACYEWVMTDRFDPNNAEHMRIKRGIEIGTGIANLVPAKVAREAMKEAGFELLVAEDRAHEPQVPWYEALAGTFSLKGFKMTHVGRWVTDSMLRVLEAVHLAPQGARDVSQMLIRSADSLVEGGRNDLFTPMLLLVGRKPE